MENAILLLRRLNKYVHSNVNYTADINELADNLDIDIKETTVAFYYLISMGYIANNGIGYICSITPTGIQAASRSKAARIRQSPVMVLRRKTA